MPVVDVQKDVERHSLTMVSQFAAPVDRVWQVWADPRQLERWWGPPTYPATVTDHDLSPGGRVTYVMTGPDGSTYGGWWNVTTVQAPHLLEFQDGFGDAEGNPVEDMPVGNCRVELAEHDGGTRMTQFTSYASAEDIGKVLAMGVIEGATAALSQIDDLIKA